MEAVGRGEGWWRNVWTAALVGCVACSGPQSEADQSQVAESDSAETALTEWTITPDLMVEEVAEGVWLHTTWTTVEPWGRILSNGLIVRDGSDAVLIDTAWGIEPTAALIDWIEETLELRVSGALITHFHDDRMGGGPVLAERGIPFYGSELTLELSSADTLPAPELLPGVGSGEPLHWGPVEAYYPGPGHTRDNLVVWVPGAEVLFGGCAVRPGFSQGAGNTADADMAEWPESLRRVQGLYGHAVTVIPAHGAPGPASLLDHSIEVLERARAESP